MNAKGLDDRKLTYEQIRKSVSVDVNYGIRFNDDEEVKTFLRQICDELSKRLVEIDKKGKCITLKIMMRAKDASVVSKKFLGFGEADKVSKSSQLMSYTNDPLIIFASSVSLLTALNIPSHELRGIGIQVSKLEDERNEGGGKLLEMFKKIAENPNAKHPINRVKIEPSVIVKKKVSPKKKGRPVKKIKSNSNLTSVAEMFSNKKPSTSTKRKVIDPDVLAQLPPDIVEEVLRDYDVAEDDETVEVEPKFNDDCNIEITEDLSENIFMQENWRITIKTWIESMDNVDEEYSKIINDSLIQLVRVKNLELLFVAMRFLHRNIQDVDKESWQVAYQHMFYENLQCEMMKFYNRQLSTPYDFK